MRNSIECPVKPEGATHILVIRGDYGIYVDWVFHTIYNAKVTLRGVEIIATPLLF